MDPKSLYPEGFHPCWQCYTLDVADHAKHITRKELVEKGPEGVRYYFIDFGISSWVRGTEEWQRYATGDYGIDQDVPELHFHGEPYDPFMVDIFIIGNMIKKTFVLVRQFLYHFNIHANANRMKLFSAPSATFLFPRVIWFHRSTIIHQETTRPRLSQTALHQDDPSHA